MLKKILWAAFGAALLTGCLNDGGTEIPNELVGKELIAGKGAAVDAEIQVIPVGYVPGGNANDTARMPSYTARTDAAGRFKIVGALPGQYNVIAVKDGLKSLRDSLAITGKAQDLGGDTLRVPGTLTGTIALQPNHDPRTATVHALGTTVFVNVDSIGGFVLKDLAPGQYRLRVETTLDGYTPLFDEVTAHSGLTENVGVLTPFYSLTPVVRGLQAATNQDGTVTVRWNKTSYGASDGYLIYRDTAGAILPSTSPVARVQDTVYVDTVFSNTPKPGQYPYLDTIIRQITYRVRLLDLDGKPGPAYAKTVANAFPPGKAFVSGKWRQAAASTAFGKRYDANLVEFKGRLWLFGGNARPYYDLWSSADGLSWSKESDSVPLPAHAGYRMLAFRDKLWLIGPDSNSLGNGLRCLNSLDGKKWDSLPIVEQTGLPFTVGIFSEVAAFKDRLWIIDGYPTQSNSILSSPDGVTWTVPAFSPPEYYGSSFPGVAVFAGSLWRIGGGSGADGIYMKDIWKTDDGATWTRAADSSALGIRYAHKLVAAGPRLYSFGGTQPSFSTEGTLFANLDDQVWVSTDGVNWTLSDSHAPFGKRSRAAAAYFKGKLWYVGGYDDAAQKPLGDIWVMDDP